MFILGGDLSGPDFLLVPDTLEPKVAKFRQYLGSVAWPMAQSFYKKKMDEGLIELTAPLTELAGGISGPCGKDDPAWKVQIAEDLDDAEKEVNMNKWKQLRCLVAPSRELMKTYESLQAHVSAFDLLFKKFNHCGLKSSAMEILTTVENYKLYKMAVYVLGGCIVTQSLNKKLTGTQTLQGAMLSASKWWADTGLEMPQALVGIIDKACR